MNSNRFSFIFFKFTFDVGAPKILKLPWPFLVKIGLRTAVLAALTVGDTVFFVARDVDGFGDVDWLWLLPVSFGKSALLTFGRTPHWGSTHLRSN